MIPYCRHEIEETDLEAVSSILTSDWITQGPAGEAFERALCQVTGARHAVAVSSGTSALLIALQALGVGPGDEVIVPSLTFLATANAVLLCGARPVFADVDPKTLSLDPVDVSRRTGPRTRGAILVHYAGHVGDVEGCRAALGPGRFVLEDACHALGATVGGVGLGSDSEAACFSFHPAKHVTTGEGGAITSRDEGFVEACRRLRSHGVERDPQRWQGLGLPETLRDEERGGWVYEMQALSANHRLSDIGAALGTSQLARLDGILRARRALAQRYSDQLLDEPRVERLAERPGTGSAWHLYPIRIDRSRVRGGRAAIHRRLREGGVGAQVHYIPIHLQPWYRQHLGTGFGDLPATEAAYLELLSLPLFPSLARVDQDHVLAVLRAALDAETGA